MKKAKYHVVMDVSVEGTERWEGVLRNIENMRTELGPDNVEIEAVVYGKAWPMLARPEKGGLAELHPKVEAVVRLGVRVSMCENTMRRLKLTKADLMPFATTVSSAMGELVRKQAEGWAYLKPGP